MIQAARFLAVRKLKLRELAQGQYNTIGFCLLSSQVDNFLAMILEQG